MCGIGGILMYPMVRDAVELDFIRSFSKHIMIENEKRGNHSSGMAVFNKNKSNDVFKNCVKASTMAENEEFLDFQQRNIHNGTANILIHTRLATKGAITNNDNNHPIVADTVIGVHNGMIYNDEELFFDEKLKRKAEVDSEVIFRLVDKVERRLSLKKLQEEVAEKLSGMFTFAFVRKNHTNLMYIVRNDNPITMVYIEPLNLIAFASEKKFLEDALLEAMIETNYSIFVGEEDLTWLEPKRESIYMFDVNVDNALAQMEQKPHSFTENNDYGYGYGYSYGYNYGYGNATTTTTKNSNIFQVVQELLTEEEFEEFEDRINQLVNDAWDEGYADGRASLDIEREMHKAN